MCKRPSFNELFVVPLACALSALILCACGESNVQEVPPDAVASDTWTADVIPPEKPESPADKAQCAVDVDFDSLEACCDLAPAHCLSMDKIPTGLQGELEACASGGACVPDSVLISMQEEGSYTPKECASIGGAPGGCVSVCVPRVGDLINILPQDVCSSTERCTPCIDPLTQEETGVCSGTVECSAQAEETPVAAADCPDMGSLAAFSECCDTGPARCMPMDNVPSNLQTQVAVCDDGGACVPEEILSSMADKGEYTPTPCTSVGGADGRCVSTCVPQVAEFASILPQDNCADHQRCAPCFDPLLQQDTGICNGSIPCAASSVQEVENNEEGPQASLPAQDPCENPPTQLIPIPEGLTECCPGARCLAKSVVPAENHSMLAACDNNSGLCVPDTMIATGGLVPPQACISVGGTEGRCLSTCIPGVAEKSGHLPQDVCASDERCSPCCDPFTGQSTGACDQQCDSGPAEGTCGDPIFPSCCGGAGHCLDKDLVPESQQSNVKKCKGEHKGKLCVPDEMQDPEFKGSPCVGTSLFGEKYEGVCLPDCLKIPFEFTMDALACQNGYVCVTCTGPLGGSTGAPGCVN